MLKYSRLINILTALAVAALVVACSSGNGGDEPEPTPTAGKTVTVAPDRETFYRNPFSGWLLYSGLGDGLADDFWEHYDNFPSQVGNVKVSDYASSLLIRIRWSHVEQTKGVFAWQDGVDNKYARRLRMLREGAKARGLKLVFNFTVDSRDFTEQMVPEYVRQEIEAAGGKVYRSGSSNQYWTPYPDDPVFQKCYADFMRAFAKEFNNDQTTFIGGFGIGLWGEYHTCIYSTGDGKPKEAVFDWITDLWAEVFTNVPIACQVHRCIGATTGSGAVDPDAERLIQKAVDKGFSLQSAAFGMTDYFASWEKNILLKHRYKAPIAAEGGWITGSGGHRYWTDSSGKYREGHPEDVRLGEYDDAIGSCVNTLDLRYSSDFSKGETASWFSDAYELVTKWLTEGCYRLYPGTVVLPENISANKQISIQHRWTNLGYSYCPTNLPQYHDKYKVAFALLNPSTNKPVKVYFDEQAKPCDWHKSKPTTYTFKFNTDQIAAGKYTWAVGIVDTSKPDNEIGIYIAAKNGTTADGWVTLCDVTVK